MANGVATVKVLGTYVAIGSLQPLVQQAIASATTMELRDSGWEPNEGDEIVIGSPLRTVDVTDEGMGEFEQVIWCIWPGLRYSFDYRFNRNYVDIRRSFGPDLFPFRMRFTEGDDPAQPPAVLDGN